MCNDVVPAYNLQIGSKNSANPPISIRLIISEPMTFEYGEMRSLFNLTYNV